MVSLLVTGGGTPQIEMATIGQEGVSGASEVLQLQPSMGLTLIQIPGDAVRIKAESFRKIISVRPLLQKVINQHLYALMRQILYGAACNRMHNMEKRCARWLLMTHDRAASDTFPLTQQFLSHMLGVRRATVNAATGTLKKAGLIRYVRGKITVTDRAGLESATCGCYRAIIAVYDSLLPSQKQGR
jgi:CRP-like cAMP-binding protein